MKTAVIGYPRVGKLRELKFVSEKYFRNEVSEQELKNTAAELRKQHWLVQKENNIDFIPSNDFSFYDNMLDTAFLLNIIPERYNKLNLSDIDTYFSMARGYQGDKGDVKALAMKKWFNTNYHYMVPEYEDNTTIKIRATKIFDEFTEAKNIGINTTPTLIGPFTFVKLLRFTGKKQAENIITDLADAYIEIINKLDLLGAKWLQLAEPYLVKDVSEEDFELFSKLYTNILSNKGNVKILLQSYFGDIRDCYNDIINFDFDGIGIDFVEGKKSIELIQKFGFPNNKVLFAGLINGKNIWKNNYNNTISTLSELKKFTNNIVLSTSCSLLHSPYTLNNETKLSNNYKKYFSFAEEKLTELKELKSILLLDNINNSNEYKNNKALFEEKRLCNNTTVQERLKNISNGDFTRLPAFDEREKIQKAKFNLPILPTTTIGSFPQTKDVKANRSAFKRGDITAEQYTKFNKGKIADCIKLQEDLGIDVLVHGEYERNDMVEYFGENLEGFLFTEKAWVQSYGTRCVKPPIIWGDISRKNPITVDWAVYAQSLTDKPVKGMLTGPVTILNWSFPREDISLKECALQIALAVRDEVLDLEKNGINIIQVDEAALREKLPLKKQDWHTEYLDWAIDAFRLVHSGVKAETQIHTHMCYSEFDDIIKDIDNMDADVITFEASRSDLQLLDTLNQNNFKTEVGPGVYDIHSPRVPSVEEIKKAIYKMLDKVDINKLWINPDCGLKTRGVPETVASLKNLVLATLEIRKEL